MASQSYVLNGPVSFVFPYPVRQANQLTLETSPGGVVAPGDYTVTGAGPNATQVTITWLDAPDDGTKSLIISRYTEPDRVADFAVDGIEASGLDAEFDNAYQILDDQDDAISRALKIPNGGTNYDAGGVRITDLADPTNPQDAATKAYTDLITDAVAQDAADAEAAKDAAETAQGLSEDARDAAQTAQGLAEDAQTAAETAETNAETAQTAAELAETNAGNHEGESDANASQAEAWATETGSLVDLYEWSDALQQILVTTDGAGDYSAKEYAVGDEEASGGSAKAWATDASSPDGSSDQSAKTYAGQASGHADDAETAQGLAEDARDAAQTAESNAETAESGAVTAQGLAEDARDAAQTAETGAEAALDEFTDLYLGAKTSDPTTDNDGNALQDGALYFNTTSNEMRVYDLGTTTWIAVDVAPVDSVFGRTGAVVAQASDYDASQIDNDSGVAGTFVSSALNNLNNDKLPATLPNANYLSATKADGTEGFLLGIAGNDVIFFGDVSNLGLTFSIRAGGGRAGNIYPSQGFAWGVPTGGDPGAGIINAEGLQINGQDLEVGGGAGGHGARVYPARTRFVGVDSAHVLNLDTSTGAGLDTDAIAIHPGTGDLFVLDKATGNVSRFGGIPTTGGTNAQEEFAVNGGIVSIAIDGNGVLYGVNNSNSTIYKYDTADGSSLGTFSGANAEAIAVDDDGNIALISNVSNFIAVFAPDGTLLRFNSSFSGFLAADSAVIVGGSLITRSGSFGYAYNYYTGEELVSGTSGTFNVTDGGLAYYGGKLYQGTSGGEDIYVTDTCVLLDDPSRFEVNIGNVPSLGSSGTQSHGFNATPWFSHAVIRCTSAEGGYSVGEEININGSLIGTSIIGGNIQISANSTSVRYVVGAESVRIYNEGTGDDFSITLANWDLILRAQL